MPHSYHRACSCARNSALLLHIEQPHQLPASLLPVSAACSFTRDGILLLHKEGQYEPGTSTPLALLWKDAACSRYFIDTDAAGGWVLNTGAFVRVGTWQATAVEGVPTLGGCP